MTTKNYLTLYHGTVFSRAQEINRSGEISNSAVSMMNVADALKTTVGFVYLTINPGKAVYYGNGLALENDEDQFCIYRCVLDISELSADIDELNIKYGIPRDQRISTEESLLQVLTCRINRSLKFGTDITDYIFLPSRLRIRVPSVTDLIHMRDAGHTQCAIDRISELPWFPVHKQNVAGQVTEAVVEK